MPKNLTTVQPLPLQRRRSLFLLLLLTFLVSVPIFAFYATGYRYDFFDAEGTITATGGLYISVNTEEPGEVFVNEQPITDARLFRRALYIQDVTPGVQRVHVQKPGMHTWVKELPVYPHIVTEAQAILYPDRPQIRLITEYVSATGSPVVFLEKSDSSVPFYFASTTLPIYATTSKATSTYERVSEYQFILDLFGTTTTATSTVIDRVVSEVSSAFSWSTATTAPAVATSTATTTVVQNDMRLYETSDGIFVEYVGPERSVPYYFCIPNAALASTTELYGPQVTSGVAQVLAAVASTTFEGGIPQSEYRTCRTKIKIDTQWQNVRYFTFMPGTTDVVLLHRDDGIFAVEVDDRSWQNTQRLYPESADVLVVHNGQIYVKDEKNIFELLLGLIDSPE